MKRASAWGTAVVAIGATWLSCGVFVSDGVPLGVPSQWVWGRLRQPIDWPAVVAALGVLLGYAALVGFGLYYVASATRARCTVAIATLLAAGFVASISLQSVSPFGLAKWPFVLFMPSSSGYYTAARGEVTTAAEFLTTYDRFQSRHGPFHLGTHPPGLVLLHYTALRTCERSPTLVRAVLAAVPTGELNRFKSLMAGQSIAATDLASLWLVAWVTECLCLFTLVPLYRLARRVASPVGAWAAAALWPLVPAIGLFMPKSDVLYPFFAVTAAMFATGVTTRAQAWLRGSAAGLVICVGMSLTFGLVAVLPLIGLAIAFEERGRGVGRGIERGLAIALGLLFGVALLWVATDHNLIQTWWACYRKHASFYTVMPRSYWKWVWVNVIEFAASTGVVPIVLAVADAIGLGDSGENRQLADGRSGESATASRGRTRTLIWAWWLALIALDLSGKNRGEIARLWIFLMPFALLSAARLVERWPIRGRLLGVLVLTLAIQNVVMQSTVQGFIDPLSIPEVRDRSRVGRGENAGLWQIQAIWKQPPLLQDDWDALAATETE